MLSRRSFIVVASALGIALALVATPASQAAPGDGSGGGRSRSGGDAPPTVTATPQRGERGNAGDGNVRRGAKQKSVSGEVTSKSANGFVLMGRGGAQEFAIQVDSDTRYHQPRHGSSTLNLANITVGMRVTVFVRTPDQPTSAEGRGRGNGNGNGRRLAAASAPAETFLAARVILPPAHDRVKAAVGTITALTSTSISVLDARGGTLTAQITANTRLRPADAVLALGDQVALRARWSDDAGAGGAYVAQGIVKGQLPGRRERPERQERPDRPRRGS